MAKLYDAFKSAMQNIKNESDVVTTTGDFGNINMSSIYTELIQNAGRFCEKHASDILYDIKQINEIVNINTKECGSVYDVIYIGMRRHGTDNGSSISDYIDRNKDRYRKVFAVEIKSDKDDVTYAKCTLIDITDYL